VGIQITTVLRIRRPSAHLVAFAAPKPQAGGVVPALVLFAVPLPPRMVEVDAVTTGSYASQVDALTPRT
jgi:hypothetical protein